MEEQLPLMKGEENGSAFLPLLNSNINPLKKEVEMELKTLALQLGLSETADEATVLQKVSELKLKAEGAAALQKQVDELKAAQETLALAGITAAVDQAVSEKRIDAGMKNHFVELGKKVGIDTLKLTLSAMQPQGKSWHSCTVPILVNRGGGNRLLQVREAECRSIWQNNGSTRQSS